MRLRWLFFAFLAGVFIFSALGAYAIDDIREHGTGVTREGDFIISFVEPTPLNGSAQTEDFIDVNVSSSYRRGEHYAFVELDRDVFLWARFEESANGELFDESYYSAGNRLTLLNGAALTQGNWGNSVDFDGVNDYVRVLSDVLKFDGFTYTSISPELDVHQGVARDNEYFYLSHTDFLRKVDSNFNVLENNYDSLVEGTNHNGDPSYYGGRLYVPQQYWGGGCIFANMTISVFNSDDLSFIETHDVSAQGHEVSGVFADGEKGIIYVVSYCDSNQIFKYDLKDFSFIGNISLSSAIPNMQGITKKEGFFYVSSDSPFGEDRVYKISLLGDVLGRVWSSPFSGQGASLEGLDYTQDKLAVLNDNRGVEKLYFLEPSAIEDEISVSLWVKLNELPSSMDEDFAGIFDSNEDGYVVYEDKANRELRFNVSNENGISESPGIRESDLFVGEWSHVVGVYDGSLGTAKIYLNGILADTHSNIALTGKVKKQTPFLGRGSGSGNYFNGSIDEVIVFNRALSGNEIKTLYSASQTQYFNGFSGLNAGEHVFSGKTANAIGDKISTEDRVVVIVDKKSF